MSATTTTCLPASRAPSRLAAFVLLALVAPSTGCIALKADQDELAKEVDKLRNEVLAGSEAAEKNQVLAAQLGNKEEARAWYDRAAEWMVKNSPDDDELRRFRGEARQLLAIEPAIDR